MQALVVCLLYAIYFKWPWAAVIYNGDEPFFVIQVNTAKLAAAKKTPDTFKVGRKLLPEFFTPAELPTNTCLPTKLGKARRPLADQEKLDLLLGTYLIFSHFSAEGNPCHFVFNLNYYH